MCSLSHKILTGKLDKTEKFILGRLDFIQTRRGKENLTLWTKTSVVVMSFLPTWKKEKLHKELV